MAAQTGRNRLFKSLLRGEKVFLTPPDFGADVAIYTDWCADWDFWLAMHDDLYRTLTVAQVKKRLEGMEKEDLSAYQFAIRAQDDGRLVGWIRTDYVLWSSRTMQFRMAIGDSQERGKGFGKDALELMLRHGFDEMNFNHISIPLVSYQVRAQTGLKRKGFKEEVRRREAVYREGKYWDELLMGVLAAEWWQMQPQGEIV